MCAFVVSQHVKQSDLRERWSLCVFVLAVKWLTVEEV